MLLLSFLSSLGIALSKFASYVDKAQQFRRCFCRHPAAQPAAMSCTHIQGAKSFVRQISRILDSLAWEIRMEFFDIADVDRDGLLAFLHFHRMQLFHVVLVAVDYFIRCIQSVRLH